jgi:hypothetical protein
MVCPIVLILHCVDLNFTVLGQRSPFIFPPWAPSTNALFIQPSYNYLTVYLCITLFFHYLPDICISSSNMILITDSKI